MNKLLTIVVLFFVLSGTLAQTQGVLDSTFNGTGSVILVPGVKNDIIYDLEVQSDGYILSTGVFIETGTTDFDVIVSRLRPEGALDLGFAVGGYYKKDFGGFFDQAKTLKITPDKKILVGGGAGITNAITRFMVMRLTMNGETDTTFGSPNGYVLINCGNSEDYVHDLTILDNGKILCAGESRFSSMNGARVATLFRLETNGSLDTTFGVNGFTKFQTIPGNFPAGSTDYFQAITVQPDGKIVAAGYSVHNYNFRAFVARFNDDGSLDSTFNFSGFTQVPSNSFRQFYDVELDWPNRIVMAGIYNGANFDAGIYAVDTAGQPDLTFGVAFSMTTIDFGGEDRFFQIDKQTNGKYVVVGSTTDAAISTRDFLACRFLANGLPDATFGINGSAIFDLGSADNFSTVDIQVDGKIVAGGTAGIALSTAMADMAVLRFTGDYDNTGISMLSSPDLNVYPVPVQGRTLTIEPGAMRTAPCSISLFNILGTEITKWDLSADNNRNNIQLDLPALSPGTYVIRYVSGSSVITRTIIVGR